MSEAPYVVRLVPRRPRNTGRCLYKPLTVPGTDLFMLTAYFTCHDTRGRRTTYALHKRTCYGHLHHVRVEREPLPVIYLPSRRFCKKGVSMSQSCGTCIVSKQSFHPLSAKRLYCARSHSGTMYIALFITGVRKSGSGLSCPIKCSFIGTRPLFLPS